MNEKFDYEKEAMKKLLQLVREVRRELEHALHKDCKDFRNSARSGAILALEAVENALFDLLRNERWEEVEHSFEYEFDELLE